MDAGTHLVLSEAQVGRLRAAVSGSLAWQAAVELMLDLGLRRNEMFALRAGDVDLVKRRICRPRRLPIPAGLLDHLRLLVECLDEDDLVFSGNWYHPRVVRV